MTLTPSELREAVEREVVRAGGDLGLAIHILRNDACGASWDAPVRDIYNAALKLEGERKARASTLCGPRSAASYIQAVA